MSDPPMNYHTIPDEVQLSSYMSSRLLGELQLALRLIGLDTCYMPPRDEPPHIIVRHSSGEYWEEVYALPWLAGGSNLQWWFEWTGRECICPAVDMGEAARIIAEQMSEEI